MRCQSASGAAVSQVIELKMMLESPRRVRVLPATVPVNQGRPIFPVHFQAAAAMEEHATEDQLVHHQQDWADASLAHLPLAQPLEQPSNQMQFPNLMPAITTLIMQITSNLSHGNPQLALFFQPLVNMALNMQLQAWQQASATAAAHSLPMALMEQMHAGLAMAPQQAAGGMALDATAAAATAAAVVVQHAAAVAASEQQAVVAAAQQQAEAAAAAPGALSPPVPTLAAATPHEQPVHTAQEVAPDAALATAVAAVAAATAAAPQPHQRTVAPPAAPAPNNGMLAVDTTAGIAPTYRETYESEGSGEEPEDDNDDDYTAKGERGGRRGVRGNGGAHRPRRTRKRNKLLDEYLTDEEEGGGGPHPAKQRRAHLE